MESRTLIQCETCDCSVRVDRLQKHNEKHHSIEAERRKAEDKKRLHMLREQRKRMRKREELQRKVEAFVRSNKDPGRTICKFCGSVVNRKNLSKHIQKCHSGERPTLQVAVPVQRISRDRRQHLNKLFAPDLPYSEDVFDRGVVSSGGAYGLGRNRRH